MSGNVYEWVWELEGSYSSGRADRSYRCYEFFLSCFAWWFLQERRVVGNSNIANWFGSQGLAPVLQRPDS